MCRHCPAVDPADLVIRLELSIRFRREMTDRELAESYFGQWGEWPAGKRHVVLGEIRAARTAAEVAEMEEGLGG